MEKNISRLAAGWNERGERVVPQLGRQAGHAARNELYSSERIAVQKASTVEHLREHVRRFV